jgi:hypothetical protein
MRNLWVASACTVACVLMAGPAGASEKVQLRVAPSISFAPADLVIRAIVPSNAKNRAVEIVAESPDFYRSSEVQLDGDRAPVVTECEYRDLPAGRYTVTAVLKGSGDKAIAVAREEVRVMAAGDGPGR